MKQQPLLDDRNDIHYLYRNLPRQDEPKVDHYGNAMRIAKKINHRNAWKLADEFFRELQAGIQDALRRQGFCR